jgi:glycosyltransferase involved in cell wall biosynthesis
VKILYVNKKLDEMGGQQVMVIFLAKSFSRTASVYLSVFNDTKEVILDNVKIFTGCKQALMHDYQGGYYDVIHYHNPFHFFTFFAIILLRGKKKICTFHSHQFSPNIFKRILLRLKNIFILNLSSLFIDKYVFLTNYDRNFWIKRMIFKQDSIVIPNCLDFSFHGEPRKEAKIHTLLFIGKMVRSKGVDIVLRAAEQLPDLKFILIGQGLGKRNLPKNCDHMTYLKRDDLMEYYKKSDILILPSYSECFPIIILEAFAYGLPVICSNVTGLSEIVENDLNGILLDENTPAALVKSIEYLIRHPDKYLDMSRNNIEKAMHRYSQENMLEKYREVYGI